MQLEARRRGDLAAVDVIDSGPGPPPELAETLCEPFVTSKPEGVGLGLALAQQVASDHGGKLFWTRGPAKPVLHSPFPSPRAASRKGLGHDGAHPDR